jgi:hypothetical protein
MPRSTATIIAIVALLVIASSVAATAYLLEHDRNSSRNNSPVVRYHQGPPFQAPLAPPFSLGNATNATSEGVYFYNFSVVDAWDSPMVSQVGLEVKTFDCAPVSAVSGIDIVGPTGQPLAWERNSSSWGIGGSITVSNVDSVSILSRSTLVGDEWIMNWTEPGASGESGGVIAGTGAWEGCDYTPDYPPGSNFSGP